MKVTEFKSMSADELWTLHAEISSFLATKLSKEKAVLEKRLHQLKSGHLIPNVATRTFQRARRPYPQVLPKYRNPAKPGETWSGRGKQPRWLTAQLKSGRKLDDFRIEASSARALRSNGGRKAARA
jgi:DNA-binding protein H-NS